MTHKRIIFSVLIQTLTIISLAESSENQQVQISDNKPAPSIVKIQQTGEWFELIRNGRPYFINGAGGTAYMDALVKAGGNSVRTWSSSKEALDKAQEKGLTVCMGLRMAKPRHGDDYKDAKMLLEQRNRIADEVTTLKSHPALLLWAIGNEVEHYASDEDSILVWKEIEKIARMIKKIDPNHPVITVIAGAGQKLENIREICPTLDAIGINSYGELGKVPVLIEQFGWKKPYLITEFGPRGWWEVEKTAWGLPLEDTSTEKAKFYYDAYKAGIDKKPNCLGSYVFLWGNKQEKTHTWFNLFLPEGSPTEMVDTMTFVWTGKWPRNMAPIIGEKEIYTRQDNDHHFYTPSEEVVFCIETSDPDGDELTIKWDLRVDGSDNPATGGDWEERIPPIEGAVISSASDMVTIQMPQESGNYRVFVYVYDPSGKVATANLPIQVK